MVSRKVSKFKKILLSNHKDLEDFFNSSSNLEIIMAINNNLRSEVLNIINKVISTYKKVPITADDIYNEFLNDCPVILRKYKYQSESNFYAYIAQVVKNFCLNKLNYWLRKKRSIDLNMSSIDEMIYITDISAEKEMNDKVDQVDFIRLFHRFFSKSDIANIELILSKKWIPHSTYKLNSYRDSIIEKIALYYSS